VRFGLLLALAATGWVVVSASLITVLAGAHCHADGFLQQVVLAPDGRLFTLWLGLGSLLAAPILRPAWWPCRCCWTGASACPGGADQLAGGAGQPGRHGLVGGSDCVVDPAGAGRCCWGWWW
jgi:hypothetical protein